MHSSRPRGRHRGARRTLLAAAVGALAGAAPAPARAQAGNTAADTALVAARQESRHEIRQAAQQAQRSFELRRRQLLPTSHGGGDRCDARVGRYCYWYDERLSPGPEEPARIAEARRALLETLDAAARRLPEDDWLAGQRVRYWVEAGAADTAVAAARRCAGTAWWCAALHGMALHAAGHYEASGRAFDRALATMPADDACRWRDIGILLEGDVRDRYRALGCADRADMEERFWWLSDPLLSWPGNDRRTEHFTRHVLSRLHTDAPSPYSSRWGDDLHELLVRYGWPERWSRREPTSVASVGPLTSDVIGHEPIPSYRFGPTGAALRQPLAAHADAWALRDPAARERYTPAHARLLRALPASVIAFRRGDSLLLAAAFRLRGDSVLQRLAAAPVRAAIAAAGGAGAHHVTPAISAHMGELGAATLLVPEGLLLVGVEVHDDSGRAARWRAAVAPPTLKNGLGLSELLLFQPISDADTALARALAAPIVDGRTPALPRLGLYWELYGLAPGMHAVEMTLVVQRAAPGVLRRAWQRLRGSARGAPVHLQWTDVVGVRAGWTPRTMQVAIPDLPAGEYEVELRARAPGGVVMTTTRTLVIERS